MVFLYSITTMYHFQTLLKSLEKCSTKLPCEILSNFHTLPTLGIKVIIGLILIHLHLQKLDRRQQLRMVTLPHNHIIKFLLENRHANSIYPHHLSLEHKIPKQQLKIKSSIINTNNHLNRIFILFNTLNKEFLPG